MTNMTILSKQWKEDLYEFIDTAARIAGLESEEDITEEWREW